MEDEKRVLLAFDGRLVGSKNMKTWVVKTLAAMDQETIRFITKNCWFMSSMDDAWAFTFTGNDLKNMHLIFLSDELFNENISQIQHSIAHEIGHVILGHRNSTFEKQSKKEIDTQEREADNFASKFGF